MIAFQAFVHARVELARPDNALDWTAAQTGPDRPAGHPYLASRLLRGHTAWDSEYYLSIALHGYDDPASQAASPASTSDAPLSGLKSVHPAWVSLNHAFFPGYPAAVALLARPAAILGAPPIESAVVTGVAISLFGTLGAMLAIAELARHDGADRAGEIRAAFYLVVWPGAAFLAQVYSEGLFLGLSFGALALLARRQIGWAALLAAGASLTRPTGVLLELPFAWTWLREGGFRKPVSVWWALAPALAWLAWRLTLGPDFQLVQDRYFGRGLLSLASSWDAWTDAAQSLFGGSGPARAAAWLEIIALVAGVAFSAVYLPRNPRLAVYGLAGLAVAVSSGAAVGLQRYVLAAPALFLAPAALGAWPPFDRLWTLASCLGLAILATLFSFGFWAG